MKKFLKGINGKQVLVSVLSLMVVIAGIYRWNADRNHSVAVMTETLPESVETKSDTEKTSETEETGDYFSKARYERDCARSEAAELLKVSGTDGETSEELIAKNREMLEKAAKNIEKEAAIENMVIAKGYSDCVAFMDDSGIRVVVKADSLEAEGVAQIKDIIVGETGLKATEIKISTKQ